MKKLILTIAALAGLTVGAYAQGTVSFNNFNGTTARVWLSSTANAGLTGDTNGASLAPFPYHVELLFGPLGSASVSNSSVVFNNANVGNGQFFDGTTVFLTSTVAGTGSGDTNNVVLQIRGWTGAFADWNSAFAAAQSGNANVGFTTVFSNPTGGAGTALPANLVGWLANNALVLSPVPEPSTIALGGLGVAALLLFRRRK